MKEDDKEYNCEKVLPYDDKGAKTEQVQEMFNTISTHYDAMNRTMTMGVDIAWRRKSISKLKKYQPKSILDVATGTGDFAIDAFRLLHPDKIIGIDLSDKMLEIGRDKIAKLQLSSKIEMLQGDSLALPFDAEQFDAVTVAFGVRNFENLAKGIAEMQRVLKPGGHLVILEMAEPHGVVKPFYRIYTQWIIPFVARLFSSDVRAYRYLPDSIKAFPHGKKMKTLLHDCGFSSVEQQNYTFGVCACYLAEK
jgi:demethylmenaquinone methyltransferase / 2-methoxy-6-polyprenyl-1,4-benzoquinol methylase